MNVYPSRRNQVFIAILALFIVQPTLHSQERETLIERFSTEDLIGAFARRAKPLTDSGVVLSKDSLNWKEREKSCGFSTNGMNELFVVTSVHLPIRVYFAEQSTIDSYDDLYGKAEKIRNAVTEVVENVYQLSPISTPDEIHRGLGTLAIYAASEACIDEERSIDYRFRFHAEVGRINDFHGRFGPKYNFATKKFEGKLEKDKKSYTSIVLTIELINPRTHELMKSFNDPSKLTIEQQEYNGAKQEWRIANHWIPDSYLKADTKLNSNQKVEMEKFHGTLADANNLVIYQDVASWESFRNEMDYKKMSGRVEKIGGKDWSQAQGSLNELKDLAFLIEILNDEEFTSEFVWVTKIKATNNGLVGEIDNSPVLVRKYSKGEKIEFWPRDVHDLVFSESGELRYGETIYRHLKQLSESDKRKFKRMSRFELGE